MAGLAGRRIALCAVSESCFPAMAREMRCCSHAERDQPDSAAMASAAAASCSLSFTEKVTRLPSGSILRPATIPVYLFANSGILECMTDTKQADIDDEAIPWYMPERLRGCYLANRDRIEADIAASPPLEGERLATVVRLLRSGPMGGK